MPRAARFAAAKLLAGFAFLFFAIPVHVAAQTVTLTGGTNASCTYSSATYTASSNTWSFVCGGTPPANTATVTFGPVNGTLLSAGSSSATIAVSCSGTCAGITSTATVTAPAAGVTTSGTITNGAGTITVNGTGALAVGNAVVQFSAPSGAGSGVTVTPSSTTNVNVAIANATSTGTLGFVTPSATGSAGGAAVVVQLQRAGAGPLSAGAGTGFSCTSSVAGYTPTISPAPTVYPNVAFTWTPGQATTKEFTVTPGTLPAGVTSATINCGMHSLYGATAGQLSYSLTITAGAPNPDVPVGCSSADAANSMIWDHTNTPGTSRQFVQLEANQTGSIKFLPTHPPQMTGVAMSTMPVPGIAFPPNYATQIQISECPGSFQPAAINCGYYSTTNSSPITFGATPTLPIWDCRLDPNKIYYYNIRFRNADGSNSCTSGTCGAYVDITYRN